MHDNEFNLGLIQFGADWRCSQTQVKSRLNAGGKLNVLILI